MNGRTATHTGMSVIELLQNWEGNAVQAMLRVTDIPSTFTVTGTLAHDAMVEPTSLEGWYVDVKGEPKDRIGFGTLELNIHKFAEVVLDDNERDDFPPSIVLKGTGPVTIHLDAIPADLDL